MSYKPNVDYYLGIDYGFLDHDNPEIDEILPVLNDLFMETEVALNDLSGACSRKKLNNAYKIVSTIYRNLANLREEYQKVTESLYQVI